MKLESLSSDSGFDSRKWSLDVIQLFFNRWWRAFLVDSFSLLHASYNAFVFTVFEHSTA